MKKFRTIHDYVVTAGKNDKRKGAFCSIEYAEQCGESGRVNSQYTIWRRSPLSGQWRAIRERTVTR